MTNSPITFRESWYFWWWQRRPKPKVFIDTRFDMYGAPLVSDSITMEHIKAGWKELFQKYQFGWVFMPSSSRIVNELLNDPAWKTIYNEQTL